MTPTDPTFLQQPFTAVDCDTQQQHQHLASSDSEGERSLTVSSTTNKNHSVLFVGNLSFFCEEKHLYDLFSQYAHIEHVRILQNTNKTKSLMYGFVTVTAEDEAMELTHLLDGHLFMGRRLR